MGDNTTGQMVKLGKERLDLFHDTDGVGYCMIRDGENVGMAFAADSIECRRYLAWIYYANAGKVPSGNEVRDAAFTLEAIGVYEGKRRGVRGWSL